MRELKELNDALFELNLKNKWGIAWHSSIGYDAAKRYLEREGYKINIILRSKDYDYIGNDFIRVFTNVATILGLTTRDIANKLGVSTQSIYKKHKAERLERDSMVTLAKALGCEVYFKINKKEI